jgi:hypothetical protein
MITVIWPTVLSKLSVTFSGDLEKTHYQTHYLYGTWFKLNLLQLYANLASAHLLISLADIIFLPPKIVGALFPIHRQKTLLIMTDYVERHTVLWKC